MAPNYSTQDIVDQVWKFERIKISIRPDDGDMNRKRYVWSWSQVFPEPLGDDSTVDDFHSRMDIFCMVSKPEGF